MTKLVEGENDFYSYCKNNKDKEFLLDEWCYEKNTEDVRDIHYASHKKVWWMKELINKDNETITAYWQATVKDRTLKDSVCPYISIHPKVLKNYNDLQFLYPDIAKDWNYDKNEGLTPDMVTPFSHKKVWWTSEITDNTGKTYTFEWEARVSDRTSGKNKNPFLSGRIVDKNFNSLKTLYPDIAEEFDENKNCISPNDIAAYSNRNVWWKKEYYDKQRDKTYTFSWQARVSNRTEKGSKCPYLAYNPKCYSGFNDIASYMPEIKELWDYEKNEFMPDEITTNSHKQVWLHCPLCGRSFKIIAEHITKRKNLCCSFCNGSRNEKMISEILEKDNLFFRREYKFSSPIVNHYKYDFFCPSKKIVIEFDGKQHFEKSAYFSRNYKDFLKQVRHDNIKSRYCEDNGLLLLRIPYVYEEYEDIDRLITTVFSKGKIPQDILDFYNNYGFSEYGSLFKDRTLMPS